MKNRFAIFQNTRRGPIRGLSIIALITLAGCFAPVAQVEAQQIAQARLDKYCRGRCGTLVLAHTQKIKGRWLIDYDGPRQKFTVTVEDDGNAKVQVWDKNLAPVATP